VSVKRLTDEEFEDRFDYLTDVAGYDLVKVADQMVESDGNPAKLIETLNLIKKAAQECSLKLLKLSEELHD